jgi:hypothetical protein
MAIRSSARTVNITLTGPAGLVAAVNHSTLIMTRTVPDNLWWPVNIGQGAAHERLIPTMCLVQLSYHATCKTISRDARQTKICKGHENAKKEKCQRSF